MDKVKEMYPRSELSGTEGFKWAVKVKSVQRPGTEAIRTQIQPSKPKREITKSTNSQNTKRILTKIPCDMARAKIFEQSALYSLHSLNFINSSMFSLAFIASYKRSLTKIYYSKLYSLAHFLSYEWFACS